MLVDELDGHRAFADGGGAAFGRAGADVAGREDARNIGLEQVVRARRGAGEDEPVVVAGHGVVEPLGARQRPEEEKEERERKAVAALEGDGLEGHGQKLCRKDLRTFKKLLLAALQPQRWTDTFHGKLFLDSDDILCAQLLADTWLELLDLPPITPKDRRRRVLERIMAMNFRTHSPTVGAANLVSRTGATLAASQAQDVWIGIQFGLVAALVSADMPEEAREILGICYYNLYEKTRIPFAVPEGFNGNSPLTVADLAYALKVDSATAQSLLTALTGCGFIQSNGRVLADIHQVTAEKFAHALQQAPQPLECSPERSSELLHLLHTWGLRYTAGRYHRPGMAFCILDMLARKVNGSSEQSYSVAARESSARTVA